MTVKKQFTDEQIEWIKRQERFANAYLVFGLMFCMIAIAAIICSVVTGAFAQAPACTVWYSAGIVVCAQPPSPTATASPKPAREHQSAGYPAPGDPTETQVMPYPPPISGDPAETPIPTRTDRPTPTLAPDCSIPPNSSVWQCENGTGVPVVTYTAGP